MKESGKFDIKAKLPLLKNLPVKRAEKPEAVVSQETEQEQPAKTGVKFLEVVRILWLAAYRLRAVFLAIPVIFAALWLAAYNSEHLPLLVGLNLQSTGEFAKVISRQSAVTMPLFLTGGCIALMCFSRKTLYPWLISILSLLVPVLLLVTNMLPA